MCENKLKMYHVDVFSDEYWVLAKNEEDAINYAKGEYIDGLTYYEEDIQIHEMSLDTPGVYKWYD